jgi:hypothetical protein
MTPENPTAAQEAYCRMAELLRAELMNRAQNLSHLSTADLDTFALALNRAIENELAAICFDEELERLRNEGHEG